MQKRRTFIKKTGIILGGISSCPNMLSNPIFKRRNWAFALVGLGSYSGSQLAPALQLTEHCELRGIVTGQP